MSTETLQLHPPREHDHGNNPARFKSACDALVSALVEERGNAAYVARRAFPTQPHEDEETARSAAERKIRRWIKVANEFGRDIRAEAIRAMSKAKVVPWTSAEAREANRAAKGSSTPKDAPAKKRAARAPAAKKASGKRQKRAA